MLSKPKVKADFTNGNHGAVKLTKDQVINIAHSKLNILATIYQSPKQVFEALK